MNISELRFHHVGLLTDDPVLAAARLERLGYRPGDAVDDPLQQARLQLCHGPTASAAIELVTPLPGNEALARLFKRRGDHMYHVCFTAPSFEAAQTALSLREGDAVTVVSGPKPAVLFDGALVAFYLVGGLGLVEILEAS
jgi:hypothetical protein